MIVRMKRTKRILLFQSSLAIFMILTIHFFTRIIDVKNVSDESFVILVDKKQIVENVPSTNMEEWMNYTLLEIALEDGPGEDGAPVVLKDEEDRIRAALIITEYSLNGVTSDKISVNRSLPDTRPFECRTIFYRNEFPPVSVIILFHDEYPSALKRTVHSVVNRTPPEMLKEVILVDDASTKENLKHELDQYLKQHLPEKVRVLRLLKRQGLMRARMEGIRNSTGDIIVVMDGHIEVNKNWLPPLIDPILEDYQTMTQPAINTIDANTFHYLGNTVHKDGFDWRLVWEHLPRKLLPGEIESDNFQTPVILGAIFAINREYFWKLGGFDPDLEVWGGEQFELSWKVWMCYGRILTVPCSQVGHNYKSLGHHPYLYNTTFILQNLKRIIDVWTDEYKQIFYERRQLEDIDAGNITQRIALRNKLKCKSFDWYLNNVFPELKEKYPLNPSVFKAYGAIQSVANKRFCITPNFVNFEVRLGTCSKNLTHPKDAQFQILMWQNRIRSFYANFCWFSNDSKMSNKTSVQVGLCDEDLMSQEFRYDAKTQHITNQFNKCLEANFKAKTVQLAQCENRAMHQKWRWGFLNSTILTT